MKTNPELLRAVRYFTREKEIMSGLLLVCEAGGRTEMAMDGDVREDSVFDLASLTKLFTGLCALKLKEEGLLDTGRPVFSYDPRFAALKDVTVDQLMTFTAELKTPGRVDGCRDREEALACLKQVREATRDARHHCYAYIIGENEGIIRYSDDGEPGGTAGMPILSLIRSEGAVNCCVVVTRYFGGILLGTGGLVRA